MTFIPPVSGFRRPPIEGASNPSKTQKNKIEKAGQTALQTLPASFAQPESKGWGFWSWLGFREKTEEQPVEVESEQEEQGYSLSEEMSDDDEFYDVSDELYEGHPDFEETERSEVRIDIPEEEQGLEISPEKELQGTALRTDEATKKGYWQQFKEAAGNTLLSVATSAIQKYAESYDKTIDKESIIAKQKQEMLDQLQDPQFVEFYELVSATLLSIVKEKLLDPLAMNTDPVSTNAFAQSSLILKVLEIALARGFANLARQVNQNQASIPDYGQQPSFVSVISLLCQKAGKHIDLQLLAKHQKNRDLKGMFNQISNEILLYILPNKLADLPEISGWMTYFFGNTIYNGIRSLLANLLQESYEALENDEVRNNDWRKDLQTCLGAPDLNSVTEAPSTLLVALTKNFIQADPKVTSFTAEILDGLMRPPLKADGVENQHSTPNQLLNQLSKQQLAHWIVESVQTMLHTKDAHLVGLGQFARQAFNNLALAFMVKGAQGVIPQGEKIEPNAFMKELSERLIDKFNSLQAGEIIPDEFWKHFVQDLPIPPILKEVLVSILIEKAKNAQEELKKKTSDFQKIQQLHAESEKKILSYKKGKELLALTEKVSDQIIEQVLGENSGLANTLGLGETVEELFSQYLPGVTLSDELKDWFKENISALGMTEEGRSAKSILLLKQGIQAVLRSALVNSIETNFKQKNKDYAEQLLKNIQRSFLKAFAHFNSTQRKKIEKALDIQAKIEKKRARIKEIKAKISKKPEGITVEQAHLLEEAVRANTRYRRASHYVNHLTDQRDAILAELNTTCKTKAWTADELPLISEALVLRKIEASVYSTTQGYVAALQGMIQIYEKSATSQKLTDAQEKEFTQRKMLVALLEMSSEELKCISDAVNTNVTLQHAQKELIDLSGELKAKEEQVAKHDQNKIKNPMEWKQAKERMAQMQVGGKTISRLSKEIADLEKRLDTYLEPFQSLSNELAGLFGLDQKEKLNLPPFLQDQVWPLIETAKKEQMARLLFTQVSPMISPIIERDRNRTELKKRSGSDFLGHVCEALSKDALELLPVVLNSHRAAAKKILVLLSNGKKPKAAQIDQLAQEISTLAKQKNVKNQTLVDAYAKVVKKRLTPKNQASLKAKIKQSQVKAEIKKAFITTEEITALIGEFVPHLDAHLKQALADEMQTFTHGNSDTYQSISHFVSTYIEGMLLRIFSGIADKNPKQKGKDTFIVLTEKLLDITTQKYQEIKEGKKIEDATKEINDSMMQDLLGIDSPEAFAGMPSPLNVKVYEAIKDQLGGFLLSIAQSLQTLDNDAEAIQKAKEEVKKFGIAENATKGYAQILAEDMANMALAAIPHVLTEVSGENMQGVAAISTGIENYLKDLSRGNMRIAKVLLNYSQGGRFQEILADTLNKMADKDAFVDDKQKAANLLSNLLIVPLGQVIERVIQFEETHKKEFNQKLMAQFLHLGAEHLKHLNAAKAFAAQDHREEVSHQDFVKAAGAELHSAVPTSSENAEMQKQAFYGPTAKSLMKLIFPNGKDDLSFVPEDLRDSVWKLLKKDLMPLVFPMMAEVILDPDTIQTVVLSSLESMRDSLSGEIILEAPEPEDLPLDPLDEAAGELIAESLQATTLPEWMKKLLLDKEGKVTPAMKKSLGATLRKQFNDTFIKEKLQFALEKAVERDAEGNPILKFDARSTAVKEVEAIEKAKKMQADLRKVSREVVDVSISYFIRSKWVEAQAHFDELVERIFGKIGIQLKKALDAVFRFIFFTVIGTILSVIFWPVKQVVKQMIYRMISLDENRDRLLAMFTQVPGDQPVEGTSHALYHENLLFKMGEVLNQTVREFLDKEVALPS